MNKPRTYRMPEITLDQIAALREKWKLDSDARVIAMAIDRAAVRELKK